jgi:hypothetical protein
MPEQITGLQFVGILYGTTFAIGLVAFLVGWWQLKRDKLPPFDEGS